MQIVKNIILFFSIVLFNFFIGYNKIYADLSPPSDYDELFLKNLNNPEVIFNNIWQNNFKTSSQYNICLGNFENKNCTPIKTEKTQCKEAFKNNTGSLYCILNNLDTLFELNDKIDYYKLNQSPVFAYPSSFFYYSSAKPIERKFFYTVYNLIKEHYFLYDNNRLTINNTILVDNQYLLITFDIKYFLDYNDKLVYSNMNLSKNIYILLEKLNTKTYKLIYFTYKEKNAADKILY